MADIATLLGTNLGGDDEALVRALRGQVEGGDVLGLSTIGQVSDMGRAQRKRAADAATRGGALRTAAERRKQQAALQAERLAAQAEQNRLGREATAEQGALNRAMQEALAKLRRSFSDMKTMVQPDGTIVNVTRDADGAVVDTDGNPVDVSQARPYSSSTDTTKPKGSVKDRRDMANLAASVREGNNVLRGLENASNAINPWVDYPAAKLEGMPVFGQALGRAVEEMGQKTAADREARAALDLWVEETRRRLAGANLTKIETILGEKWAPTNRTLTLDEVRDRIGIMQRVAQEKMEEISDLTGVAMPEDVIESPEPATTKPPVAVPPVGTVVDGMRFLGGNPKDPASWEAQ